MKIEIYKDLLLNLKSILDASFSGFFLLLVVFVQHFLCELASKSTDFSGKNKNRMHVK